MKKLEIKDSMTIREFMEDVKRSYAKYFPKSRCNVVFRNILGNAVFIDCFLAGDKSELSYGYAENDMFKVSFMIDMNGANSVDDDFGERTIQCTAKHILTAPPNRYLAYGRHDLSFRKASGDADKIIAKLDKFFAQLKDVVVDEYKNNNIADDYIDLVNDKIS